MISSIQFKNIMSFDDTPIKLGKINILTSAHGRGKTNFVRALEFLQSTKQSDHNGIAPKFHCPVNSEIVVTFCQPEARYSLVYNTENKQTVFETFEKYQIQDHKFEVITSYDERIDRDNVDYVRQSLRNIVICQDLMDNSRLTKAIRSYLKNPQTKDLIKKFFAAVFHVDTSALTDDDYRDNKVTVFEYWDWKVAGGLTANQRYLFSIVAEFLTSRHNPSILVMDDVADGLNSDVTQLLAEVFSFVATRTNHQIIVTTHSDALVSHLTNTADVFVIEQNKENKNTVTVSPVVKPNA